ncbi:MAG: hypothetical protein MJZ40_00985 [Bacteroidaceae bacterium]|nr:hypothetical protein [Bacteroidaceae bacterium]
MADRLQRLQVLRQIIINEAPSDQDEIRLALATRGYYISQPQLSKDLSRIHAYKVDGHYIVVEDTRFKRI